MDEQRLQQWRMRLTGAIALLIWSLLLWEHLHGGVPAHHLLARGDLPAISNAWGGLLLPVLGWFLLGRVARRLARTAGPRPGSSKPAWRAGAGFAGALLFGVLIAVFFTTGREQATSYLVTALVPLALLFPIHRAEYVLGFVLGMTYTFGAVLPLGFACAVALMAAVAYLVVRPLFLRLVARVARTRVPAGTARSSVH